MAGSSYVRQLWLSLLSVGAYTGESDAESGKRRIVVGYMFFGIPARIFFGALTIR